MRNSWRAIIVIFLQVYTPDPKGRDSLSPDAAGRSGQEMQLAGVGGDLYAKTAYTVLGG